MKNRIRATARVRVTVDVECDTVWTPDSPVGKVHSEAIENAKERVLKGLRDGVTFVSLTPISVTAEE